MAQAQKIIKTKRPLTNEVCERFHKIVLNKLYRIAFRRKLYRTIEELQASLISSTHIEHGKDRCEWLRIRTA